MNARQTLVSFWQGKPIHPTIRRYFHGITSRSTADAADEVVAYLNGKPHPYQFNLVQSSRLSELSSSFHTKAKTLSAAVSSALSNLQNGAPRMRYSHQVNIFFSMGVLGQFILLNEMRVKLQQLGTNVVCLYVAIDYDRAEDSRFRVAHFPDPFRKAGTFSLTGVVGTDMFNKPMWSIPKPPRTLVQLWLEKIANSINENVIRLRKRGVREKKAGTIKSYLLHLEELVWKSFEASNSFAEFNAFLISNVVNVQWKLPIAFLLGRDLQPLMKEGYEFLLPLSNKITSSVKTAGQLFESCGVSLKGVTPGNYKKFPLWYSCPNCFERLELNPVSNSSFSVVAECTKCRNHYAFDLGTPDKPDLTSMADRMSTRIVQDNILDCTALGVCGGAGYVGQADHLVLTNFVAENLGMKLPPQCIYTPKGLYFDIVTQIASSTIHLNGSTPTALSSSTITALDFVFSSKATFLYYVLNMGFDGLLDIWRTHYFDQMEIQHRVDDSHSPFNVAEHLLPARQKLIDYLN